MGLGPVEIAWRILEQQTPKHLWVIWAQAHRLLDISDPLLNRETDKLYTVGLIIPRIKSQANRFFLYLEGISDEDDHLTSVVLLSTYDVGYGQQILSDTCLSRGSPRDSHAESEEKLSMGWILTVIKYYNNVFVVTHLHLCTLFNRSNDNTQYYHTLICPTPTCLLDI